MKRLLVRLLPIKPYPIKQSLMKQVFPQLNRIILLLLALTISSCANLKWIDPFEKIEPRTQEPRISFVDKVLPIVIKPSKLPSVNPELVIESYKRLLKRGDAKIKMEALALLADLNMRLAESKMTIDDPNKLANLSSAMKDASFTEAIKLYQRLINEYPSYGNISAVKYQLARAHSLNQQPEKSLALLDQIAINPVKASSYVESQFRRGESYFVYKDYEVAEKAYSEVVMKGENTHFYDKALYKRGWSRFKLSLYEDALADFFLLYDRLINNQTTLGNSEKYLSTALMSDTRRVISLAFYNLDGYLSVNKHFAKVSLKGYESNIYKSLAELYITQERFKDAADTYMGYIDSRPLSDIAPSFHSEVIEIYKKGGFPSLILPAKEKFVVNYGRNSQFWLKHKGSVIEQIKPLLRLHLDDISIFYHAQAQKSKKPKDFLIAAKWYKEILDTFSEPKLDSQYRFLLAETLFEGKLFLASAKAYDIVAYKNIKSKYSRDAAYRSLISYQSIIYPKSATDIERLTPLILSGLSFVDAFPLDKQAPDILARVAEQQLKIQDVGAAILTSRKLLALKTPISVKQKQRALIIIANGLFDQEQYADAEVAISKLLRTKSLSRKERKLFHQRRAESIYKQAESAKLLGNAKLAISLFLKINSLEPTALVNINAQYDAATLLLGLKAWDRAERILVSFRKKYSKHKLAKGIPEKLAFIYQEQKDWNRAAKELTIMINSRPGTDFARDGSWKIAELYLKANNRTEAIKAFKHYVWTYPVPYLLAQEGRNHLIQLYTKIGDKNKTVFWRQKLIQFYHKSKENNARTSFLTAESKFILSEPLFDKYSSIKLKLPLAKSLKKKRNAMKKSLSAFESIAKYKVALYTSKATHRIAQIYQILSDDLMSSTRPKGLNEEELEEYGYLLEDQALPFEDKAIIFYEINVKRTQDGLYNSPIEDSLNALRKLKPAQYDKTEKLEAVEDVIF